MASARFAVEGERKFEALVSAVRDYAIFMLDANGRVQTWNLGARLIKGYAPEEIIGRHIETFYTESDRVAGHPQKLLARAREDGRVEDFGWRVRKDGTRFYADVVITALRDEAGTLIGYAKVTRDLTQKRIEDERRYEQEQRFRLIVDSVRDYAIFMLDATGHVTTWNPGAERIKQYRAEEIIGRHFSVFYPEELRSTGYPDAELHTALTQGKFEEEGWRISKDGTRFWASVVLTPVYASGGRHAGFVKVTRDLAERREADLERARLLQAEEAIRLRDQFLSIASHELRTPLMALQLQLESATRQFGAQDKKLAGKLERAERSVQRLSELVNALLDVTRIASGRVELHPTDADLGVIVGEVVDRMQEAAASSGCTLTSNVETGCIGKWDTLRMQQVVSNLLGNAFKYAQGAPVEVALRRSGDRVVLTVRDQGPGIAAADRERIFERFERAVDPRHFGGLGLGLYITHEIVIGHGGTIRVEDAESGGARFVIELPVKGLAS
jgi:PAS domain S-box-containing protein